MPAVGRLLHRVKERCCRWLLQTQDRLGSGDFTLKHEFLAIMLCVHRPTVTLVLGKLQRAAIISSSYERIRVLKHASSKKPRANVTK